MKKEKCLVVVAVLAIVLAAAVVVTGCKLLSSATHVIEHHNRELLRAE